jgi:hypothetical protein
MVDALRGAEAPTMTQLGLEFLCVYDRKFNYREEHTVRFFSQIKPNMHGNLVCDAFSKKDLVFNN